MGFDDDDDKAGPKKKTFFHPQVQGLLERKKLAVLKILDNNKLVFGLCFGASYQGETKIITVVNEASLHDRIAARSIVDKALSCSETMEVPLGASIVRDRLFKGTLLVMGISGFPQDRVAMWTPTPAKEGIEKKLENIRKEVFEKFEK